jgi:hypothetical protein
MHVADTKRRRAGEPVAACAALTGAAPFKTHRRCPILNGAAIGQSPLPLPELEVLRQFSAMATGQTIVDTMGFAASLSGRQQQPKQQ